MIEFESFHERHRVAVVDIFNHYVLQTTYAYRSEPLSYPQFDLFLENAEKMCGYAVVADGTIIGLCQLKPYREMSTFDKTAELTYFLEPGSTGKGLGTLILNRLTEDATNFGKDTLLASLSGENRPSYRFHQSTALWNAPGSPGLGRNSAVGSMWSTCRRGWSTGLDPSGSPNQNGDPGGSVFPVLFPSAGVAACDQVPNTSPFQ